MAFLSQNLFPQSRRFLHVIPIIVSLDLFLKLLHLFRLPLPLCLAHLRLSAEQFIVRLPVATTQSVPQCGELPVVVIKVKVVHCVACSAVDNVGVGYIFTVVYGNGLAIHHA